MECLKSTVYVHQMIKITTITVTNFMICSAFSLDSVNPLGVLPPEIHRNEDRETDRHSIDPGRRKWSGQPEIHQKITDQTREILPCGDSADRSSQNVVEHQSGNAEFRQAAAEGLLNGPVHPAADEHAATLNVNRSHGVGKQHDGQDEPGCRLADVRFRFAAGVVSGRSQVVQNDGGGSPEGNEAQ